MKIYTNFKFKVAIKLIAIITIILTLFCLIITAANLLTFDIDLTFIGIQFYFEQFLWCSGMIKISLTVIGALLVLGQLELNRKTSLYNIISQKATIIRSHSNEILMDNEKILVTIESIHSELTLDIMRLGGNTNNKLQLENIFNKYLRKNISDFENGSKTAKRYLMSYCKDNITSYSFDSFKIIANTLFSPSITYIDFEKDLYKLYFEEVALFASNKTITREKYLSIVDIN